MMYRYNFSTKLFSNKITFQHYVANIHVQTNIRIEHAEKSKSKPWSNNHALHYEEFISCDNI
jgi:hypothetical protein